MMGNGPVFGTLKHSTALLNLIHPIMKKGISMSTPFLKHSCSAAALLVLSAQIAAADINAQDVWGDWKSYITGAGYELTATETTSGDTLTVSDISFELSLPDTEAMLTVTLPAVSFIENGDGTVTVNMTEESLIGFVIDDENESAEGEIVYRQDANAMLVSGEPNDMVYDYATSQALLELTSLVVDGVELPEDWLSLSIAMDDVQSRTNMKLDEIRNYVQDYSIAALNYDIQFKIPEENANGSFTGIVNDLKFTGTSAVPADTDSTDIEAMFAAGLSFEGTSSMGSASGSGSMTDGEQSFQFSGQSNGGKADVAVSNKSISYDFIQSEADISVTSSDIPFPISLSLAELGFNVLVPLAQSEEEQDFAFGLTLRDFNVPDLFWSMVDPGNVLPRDPASLVLKLAGKGKVLTDIFDPEALIALEEGDAEPGEINALSLNELLVSAAGATLTGTGDFTFNNDDLDTFDGLPAPSGTANLQLQGANGLLDSLVQMGILSDSDATGARLMMGLLAVPGDGEDSLKSEIEISEDGQIKANGQRIK
ncbi:DUF2125 domain-containing protein [Epibacterium ulvae]|uniref:DUF2125 domain-containing protein n=1 Tax=Epibacterium ulvae TaxID=1156985 RepID=UPI0024908DD0|nr:DUF2125 domain-containing protein [Epibacterium ulvae]